MAIFHTRNTRVTTMIELILYPGLAGILLALIGGPLGSFVIWQRMAYFGESIAHSALLGIAIAIFLNINMTTTMLVVCCAMAALLSQVQKKYQLSLNTLLAIMAHTSLATGLVIISLIPGFRLDINSFLFGDLLAIGKQEFYLIAFVSLVSFIFIASQWQKLISLTTNEELAFVEGVNTKRLQLLLLLCMAVVVAIGIKAVGVLLIVSLLVIPAATSRKWVRSPEVMAILASAFGITAILAGLAMSYYVDTPAGPSIVAIAGFMYFFSQLFLLLKK
jgi:zinc transport system permease protein